MPRKYPPKSGKCSITGCKRKPTDWHHIISQAQIKKRGLPESMYTDPGNLQELCRYHHDMTTASISRKQLTKKHGRMDQRKPKKRKSIAQTYSDRISSGKRTSKFEARFIEEHTKQLEKQSEVDNQKTEWLRVQAACKETMSARGVFWSEDVWKDWKEAGYSRSVYRAKKLENAFRGTVLEGRSGAELYPPDHWAHSPAHFDQEASDIFEKHFLWTRDFRVREIPFSRIDRER